MFLPTAATGNSLCLATFGGAGEIMAFFYPHLDFAQNVREGMHGVYLHDPAGPHFLWCFADRFERSQRFEPDTGVLVTRLRHQDSDLEIETTDLLPPDEHALVRRLAVTRGRGAPRVTLTQYLNLSIGDVDRRNAVHLLPDTRTVAQQFRDVTLALAASQPFVFRTGTVRPGGGSGTKEAMERGDFVGSDQCMGDVDYVVAFEVPDQPRWEVALVLAGARERGKASHDARRLADAPFEQHRQASVARGRAILARGAPCRVPELGEAYRRAVLVLHDLFDSQAGTFIAAPEFDPHYSYSGGYGYCWPRDAAVSAMTAARLGFPDMAEAFFDWCIRTQLDDGHWFQRYWSHGAEAPSWCVRELEIQLDQTCAVLHAAAVFAEDGLGSSGRSGGEQESTAQRAVAHRPGGFVERFAPTARRAAEAILRHVAKDGLHRQSADLWECSWGTFAYTQAAVIAALRDAQRVFGTPSGDLRLMKRALVDRFWNEQLGCWARRIDQDGRVDATLDSSCLGLIEPWGVLDLGEAASRGMALQTVETLTRRLSVPVRGGSAILRFENESYMGGGPGCVNTLWMAFCRLRLAAGAERAEREAHVNAARSCITTALANSNPTGQLPELIPNVANLPYWAAPHGWASALLIECVLAMQNLGSGS